jgi:hypothetical protein
VVAARGFDELSTALQASVDGADRLLGTVLACDHRGDLLDAGKNNGNCAFIYHLPLRLPEGELRIVRVADGTPLQVSDHCQAKEGGHHSGLEVSSLECRGIKLGMPVVAVGLITDYGQAEATIGTGDADMVTLARTITYDPRWPWHAAAHLGRQVKAPSQYLRRHTCP